MLQLRLELTTSAFLTCTFASLEDSIKANIPLLESTISVLIKESQKCRSFMILNKIECCVTNYL